MKTSIISFFICLLPLLTLADPPKPPKGKRWVINRAFSDEFNGTQLDTEKWLDHHPTWLGREPGLFLSSQVSVNDGFLQIKGEKMEKDTTIHKYKRDMTFSIKGGAVVSKQNAFLGYYECRAKAAATTMSCTFWFSSSKSYKGPKETDKYGLEWDIHESIGRNGDFTGSKFANGMHSNAHFWYTDTEGKRHDHRAKQVVFDNEEVSSERFHVYGGWWRDKSCASYYYDNGAPKHQKFYDKVKQEPFDQPMYMRLVCETYPFPWIELPNEEELADPNKNVVYYDWVRGYKLVDANEEVDDSTPYEKEINLYSEGVFFETPNVEQTKGNQLSFDFCYKANENREIIFDLMSPQGERIESKTLMVFAGYGNQTLEWNLLEKLSTANGYTIEAFLKPIGAKKKEKIDWNTTILSVTK